MGSQNHGVRRRKGGPGHLVAARGARRALAATILCGALLRATPAAADNSALSADDIFARARDAVAHRTAPSFIAYTQFAAFVRRGRTRTQTDRVVVRLSDGKTRIMSLDQPNAAPHIEDRPLVFPTSTFGLAPRAPGETAAPFGDRAPSPEKSPPVIGRVSATSRIYDVTLAGSESLGGAQIYHLTLVPRIDPRHNRIRALFVDTTTFEPRRIAIEYFAERGPLRSRPTVIFDYTRVDGTWVVQHAQLEFVVRFGFLAYGGAGELRISDVSFPPTEPERFFERGAAGAAADH